jgi:hypothetical protein
MSLFRKKMHMPHYNLACPSSSTPYECTRVRYDTESEMVDVECWRWKVGAMFPLLNGRWLDFFSDHKVEEEAAWEYFLKICAVSLCHGFFRKISTCTSSACANMAVKHRVPYETANCFTIQEDICFSRKKPAPSSQFFVNNLFVTDVKGKL